jgi:hypothetical protein
MRDIRPSDGPVAHLPPEHMTAAQRRCEIASLLANGLIRLRSVMGLRR